MHDETSGTSGGFTEKAHLKAYAYSDSQRLADRAAIYVHMKISSIDLGPYPFRADGIAGFVSTWLDPSMNGAALDIGCGNGKYLPLLASQCTPTIGADLSIGMLGDVPRGLWHTFAADVESLPFADDAFSVVMANHMLYHAPDVAQACAELRRVIRPGGVLLATTNGNGNLQETYNLLAKAATAVRGTVTSVLEPADLRFTLESGSEALSAEFADVQIHRTTGALVIDTPTALDALRAYYRSVDDEWSARYKLDWPTLEAALDQVLNAEFDSTGEIRINTAGGLLVAS